MVFFFVFMLMILVNFSFINATNSIINTNTLYSNNIMWKLLFYLNNNNNSILLFFNIFVFFLTNYRKSYNLVIFIITLTLLNSNLFITDFFDVDNSHNNNTPLSNGILLIHPFFIYITYIISFCFFKYFFFKKLPMIVCFTAYVAIFLGSWWAQQELNWGGWWNWDYVELIAFIFFLYPLTFVHLKKKQYFFFQTIYKNNLFYYFLLFFIIVRCDVLSSIHSFNSFNFLEKYLYYICWCFIIFMTYFLVFKKWFFLLKYKKYNFDVVAIRVVFFKVIISSIVVFMLYNVFMFLFMSFQSVNSFFFLKLVFWFVFCYYLITYFSKQYMLFMLMLGFADFFSFIFLITLIIFYNQYLNSKHKIWIHLLIILFFFTNEYSSLCFFTNVITPISNSLEIICWDLFQITNFYLHNINIIYSYTLLNQHSNLSSGFVDMLYVNDLFSSDLITYDLHQSLIFVFFKKFTILFVIGCLFKLILILVIKWRNNFQVV